MDNEGEIPYEHKGPIQTNSFAATVSGEKQVLPELNSAREPGLWRRFRLPGSGSQHGHGSEGKNETKRAMKSRHLMMIGECCSRDASKELDVDLWLIIAIGGTIGTGLFLSAGSVSAFYGFLCRLAEFVHGTRLLHSLVQAALFCRISLLGYLYIVLSSHCKSTLSVDQEMNDCWRFCRGEMAAMYPVSGAFSVFGSRFVSPALGFTLGRPFVYYIPWRFTKYAQVGIIGYNGLLL